MTGQHEGAWWPDGTPHVGDQLAEDLARLSLPGLIDNIAVDLILDAACRETVRQIRAGETSYICVLADATRTAELLLDPS